MTYLEIEQLRERHPAWALLRASHAAVVLGFLGRVFVERNVAGLPASELVSELDDELYALNQHLGEERFPRSAQAYLDEWAAPERGWLRKFYQMVFGAEEDPELRLAELRRRRAEIDDEIARAEQGEVAVLVTASLRDRYQQFARTARELLSDFREVEDNFRRLDRDLRQQIAGWSGSKGPLLDDVLGSCHSIAESDQGRSFQAFYDFLLSYPRQQELTELLERVRSADIPDQEDRLTRIHYDWIEASERTQATVRLLSEQLRRFLDDQVWLENRRVSEDDLPRFERQFKDYLNQNTIRDIAGFAARLRGQERDIRHRIDTINLSLLDIDFNDGRYIRLIAESSPNTDVRQFRADLRACTDDVVSTDRRDQYSERKFLQVKALIDRFKGREGYTESDRNWTRRVTDVRQWFVFSASERWREDDSEYEHYSDSAGKSGGQKEKLAYTILATSLAYQFKLDWGAARSKAFRFVVIDEAFSRGSEASARYALSLFTRLGLQLLIVTPLQKIRVIEPHVAAVGFVDNLNGNHSRLLSLTITEFRRRLERAGTAAAAAGPAGPAA